MSQAAELATREAKKPFVRFERRPIEDKAASLAVGHYVAKDVDYALVTPPYSKDVFIQKAKDWFEQSRRDVDSGRMPEEWLRDYKRMYDAFANGQEIPMEGTPIRGWGVISPAMQETLTRMNILTVESLANVNDEGVRRIGMGALDLKNKASAWLAQLNDKGKLTMEMSSLQRENAELKLSLGNLQRQVDELIKNKPSEPQFNVSHETIGASDILDDSDINAQYEAKFGKKPHHLMKPETIAAKLAE